MHGPLLQQTWNMLHFLSVVERRADMSSSLQADYILLTCFALMQVVAWYDNEWGYSQRVLDLAEITAKNWE